MQQSGKGIGMQIDMPSALNTSQAVRFIAFDYILNPVDFEELQASVQRFVMSHEDHK